MINKKVAKNKRGQMNISFGLIFAIIAGVFILALAIYAVVKFTSIEQKALEGEVGKTFGILTNPLESSFESSQTITITTSAENRIYTGCFFEDPEVNGEILDLPYFGLQRISTSQKSYGKWTNATLNVSFSNKFIFSENPSEGRKFYVFSKPLYLPYKIADFVYVLSEDKHYCFLDAERIRRGDLKDEIDNMNQPSLHTEDCPEESINICFYNLPDCDISVNYGAGRLTKGNGVFYFLGDAMMFAAIISDEDTYDCQMLRTIQRTKSLSQIYNEKYDLMIEDIGCDPAMKIDLMIYNTMLEEFEDTGMIDPIKVAAKNLERANEWSECKLW